MFLGHSDTGKTTALVKTAVDAQKKGILPVFIITEQKWSFEHAKLMGFECEEVVDETTGESKARLTEPSCKVDALMDDIKNGDFGDDSVAVCAVSRQLIELLSAALTKEKIQHGLITGAQTEDERQQAVDDFQAGKIKWILFTAQAGGVGITLTAARRLIMLQRPWSLVDHKQALDRVHRIGSEIHDSIIVTDYVTEGTVEERVLQVLETKADNFEAIVRDKAQLLALLKDDKAGNL
jgi:SNF2 family DNA or RNA helicase